jgi:hypothetical protein
MTIVTKGTQFGKWKNTNSRSSRNNKNQTENEPIDERTNESSDDEGEREVENVTE